MRRMEFIGGLYRKLEHATRTRTCAHDREPRRQKGAKGGHDRTK